MSSIHDRESGRQVTNYFNRGFPHIVQAVGAAGALLLDQLYRAAAAGKTDFTREVLAAETGLSVQEFRTARSKLQKLQLISWQTVQRSDDRSSRYSLDLDRVGALYSGCDQPVSSRPPVDSNRAAVDSNRCLPINAFSQSNQNSIETAAAADPDPAARESGSIPDSEIARAIPWIQTNKTEVRNPVAYAQRCWNNRKISGLPWNDQTASLTDQEYYDQGKPKDQPGDRMRIDDRIFIFTETGEWQMESAQEAKQPPTPWRWIVAQQRRAHNASWYLRGSNDQAVPVDRHGYEKYQRLYRSTGLPASEAAAA